MVRVHIEAYPFCGWNHSVPQLALPALGGPFSYGQSTPLIVVPGGPLECWESAKLPCDIDFLLDNGHWLDVTP